MGACPDETIVELALPHFLWVSCLFSWVSCLFSLFHEPPSGLIASFFVKIENTIHLIRRQDLREAGTQRTASFTT